MQGGQCSHHWCAEKEWRCPSTSAHEASEVTTCSTPLLYNFSSISLRVHDFPFSLYKEPTIFYTKIPGWQVSLPRPWTKREHANNTVSLLQQHHIFTGINLAGASAGVYTQSPVSTNPAACSCCSSEHRTPFQNSAVISPPKDQVLFVHVHIFDYAKPETWLKAVWKTILPQ